MSQAAYAYHMFTARDREVFCNLARKLNQTQNEYDAQVLQKSLQIWSKVTQHLRKIAQEEEMRQQVVNVLKTSTRGQRSTMEKEILRRFIVQQLTCIPKNISFSEMDQLCNEVDWYPIIGRSIIFLQGDFGNVYYMIAGGSVGLYLEPSKDREMIIAREFGSMRAQPYTGTDEELKGLGINILNLPKGAGFGEYAILATTNKIRSCAVVSMTPESFLMIMHADTYNNVLRQHHYRQKQLSSATALLSELPVFKHLNYSKIASIAYTMKSQTYSSGSVLAKTGQVINNVMLVVSGQIKVYASHPTSKGNTNNKAEDPVAVATTTVGVGGKGTNAVITTTGGNAAAAANKGGKSVGGAAATTLSSIVGTNTSGSSSPRKTSTLVAAESYEQNLMKMIEKRIPKLAVAILGRGQIIGETEVHKGSRCFEMTYESCAAGTEVLEMPATIFKENLTSQEFKTSLLYHALDAHNEEKVQRQHGRLDRAYGAMRKMMEGPSKEEQTKAQLAQILPMILDPRLSEFNHTQAKSVASTTNANTYANMNSSSVASTPRRMSMLPIYNTSTATTTSSSNAHNTSNSLGVDFTKAVLGGRFDENAPKVTRRASYDPRLAHRNGAGAGGGDSIQDAIRAAILATQQHDGVKAPPGSKPSQITSSPRARQFTKVGL